MKASFATIRQSNPALAGMLVTGLTNSDRVIDAINKGLSRVCKKPLAVPQFIQVVRETLEITEHRENVTRMKILLPFYSLGQKFIAAESEQEIYEELADAVAREVGVPSVSVMMFDEDANLLKVLSPFVVLSLGMLKRWR